MRFHFLANLQNITIKYLIKLAENMKTPKNLSNNQNTSNNFAKLSPPEPFVSHLWSWVARNPTNQKPSICHSNSKNKNKTYTNSYNLTKSENSEKNTVLSKLQLISRAAKVSFKLLRVYSGIPRWYSFIPRS